ncbi:MAG: hypothetical protein AB1650_06880 [Candidatus Omnitrophota bacterium]
MGKNSGKAVTIFLVLIAIILVSLTAISVFLLIKQVQLRENAEHSLSQLQTAENALRAELAEVKKQKEILENKSKEAEAKIENLLEELDLAEGIRDEVKKENRELKDSMELLTQENNEMKASMSEKEQETERRVSELQEQLNVSLERNKSLEEKRQELEKEFQQLKEKLQSLESAETPVPEAATEDLAANVDLEKIVVSAGDGSEGQVISVDQEAAFVIINLGERHGINVGTELSIFKGDSYLGDVKVTRVLPEMSAADFISPLTSQDVGEGNLVKIKQ